MESPIVGGCMIVFVAVDVVENIKRDLIWFGLCSGFNISKLGFFFGVSFIVLPYLRPLQLFKRNGYNNCNFI